MSVEHTAPLDTVGIITCNRPATLARCLRSLVENLRRHGRSSSTQILVFDDSTRDRAAENMTCLARFRETYPNLNYVGKREKVALTQKLSAALGGGERLRRLCQFGFMLADRRLFCAGANRNTFLAYTAGRRALSLDDDSLAQGACRRRLSEPVEPPLSIVRERPPAGPEGYAERFDILADREAFDASYCLAPADFVGEHDRFLGRTVGELNPSIADGRIRFTMSRLSGAPDIPGEALMELFVKTGDRSILSGGMPFLVVEKSAGPEVHVNGDLCYHVTGVDHRQPSLPNLPMYEDEDIIASRLYRMVDGELLTVRLAGNLFHDKRGFGDIVADAARYHATRYNSEIVDRLLASAADRSGHRSSVLDQIQGEIRTLCGDRGGDLLERLAEGMELDDHYEPARRVFGEFLASIPAPEAARHQDHAAPFASRAAYQRYLDELFVDLRRTWLSFADILGCWGSLMDAARRLRETEDLPLRF